MKIFDTKSGKKVEFIPLKKGKIGMYVCGPTVYDTAHLGHGRSAVSFDVIRRYFIYKGYKVNYVSNYTDIDDKMINRARDEKIEVSELAARIIPIYEKDYAALGVMKPDVQPRATEYIKGMVDLIEKLDSKGYVYVLDDGVYFDVARFSDYGKFSGQNLEELQMGARVDVKETKRNPQDFVLWKFEKKGEPSWDGPKIAGQPGQKGRPGWHIECSAMSYKNLGESFDIHGGGLDLKFPHHECEVAQSVACFGMGTFAKYWLHNGFINIDNEKMSKSLGNFFTLKEIFGGYDPQVVRFMFLQTHYRNPVNFSHVLLDQAKAALGRIHDFVIKLRFIGEDDGTVSEKVGVVINNCKLEFEKSMDDDFDTSGALGALFDLVKNLNLMLGDKLISKTDAKYIMEFLEKLDDVLVVIFHEEISLDEDEKYLIEQRELARKERNFAKSDELRGILLKKGIVLEDTKDGTVWKKL